MGRRFCSLRVFYPKLILVFFLVTGHAQGQEVSDQQIIEVARRIYGSVATPEDEAILLLHNGRLNTLARSGKLAPGNPGLNHSYYNRAQESFSRINERAVIQAAREVGVEVQLQARKPGQTDYNPGTDTDMIVTRGPRKTSLTTADLDALEVAHQKHLKKLVRDLGHTPPSGPIRTETDFMPHPDHTDMETFLRQSNKINQRGGAAYTDMQAVNVEYALRNPDGPGRISVSDAGRYVSQQQLHADRHFRAARQVNHRANLLEQRYGPHPTEAQTSLVDHMRSEAKILQQKGAKYINRIQKVTTTMAEQNGITVDTGPETGVDRAARRAAGPRETLKTDAAGKKYTTSSGKTLTVSDVDLATIQTGAVSENLTRKAVMAHVDTMSKLAAAHPSKSVSARHSIARTMSRLSPAQQGEVLQHLEQTSGKAFTRDVAKRARYFQKPVPPAATRTLTGKALKTTSAAWKAAGTAMKGVSILNVGADIKEIVNAEDPEQALKEKALVYADGLAAGSITTAEKLGDFVHVQVEHDAYLQGVERVTHQAVETKLRRMGVDREEAQRISNAFHRGDVGPFRDKALELKAAGVVDPNPGRSGLDGVGAWDQDDTEMDRLLNIGRGIGEGLERAGKFAEEAGRDTAEIMGGLTESATVKEILWERDPRLLIDIYQERQYAAEQTGERWQREMTEYLEAAGASPTGAQRATAALHEGKFIEFRGFMRELKERRAEENRRILQEEAHREREEDNRLRAEQHRKDVKYFEETWAAYDRRMAERDARVDAAFREWTDDLTGFSPEQREQEYAAYGLSPDQRGEIERRLGERQQDDAEVEAAYQPWVDAMAGRSKQEREQAYETSGLSPEQRDEIERRLGVPTEEVREPELETEMETAYQAWADAMAGRSPEERELAYATSGLSFEQREEIERRVGKKPGSFGTTEPPGKDPGGGMTEVTVQPQSPPQETAGTQPQTAPGPKRTLTGTYIFRDPRGIFMKFDLVQTGKKVSGTQSDKTLSEKMITYPVSGILKNDRLHLQWEEQNFEYSKEEIKKGWVTTKVSAGSVELAVSFDFQTLTGHSKGSSGRVDTIIFRKE